MTDLLARFLSGDAWDLGVRGSIEEVQARVAQRIDDKLGPDVIVMHGNCVPLVSNPTHSQDTLPPLVVIAAKSDAREDPNYKGKAVEMHTKADDRSGVSKALEMMGRDARFIGPDIR